MNMLQAVGKFSIDWLQEVGESGFILFRALFRKPNPIRGSVLVIEQMYFVGVLSLLIIVVSSAFIGMVVALQGYNTLVKFGASSELGPLVALAVARELGPVIAALLFAGRAGSALTAEIALMKASDQLAGMSMMAVDPLKRIIAPRFWAGLFSLPMLTIIFDAVAIYSAYLIGVKWLGLSDGIFWSNMQGTVNFHEDIVNGIIKSIVFGFFITWIAVYQGYQSKPTPEGMAKATTRTVVYASLMVLGLDFVLTTMMMGSW